MKNILRIIVLIIVATSCQSESAVESTNKYFDLKGLIEKQIKILNSQKPLVQKIVIISDSSESQSIKTINWSKELELFMQADLNKPAFIQSYQVDSSSTSVKYTLNASEKSPVKYLKINRLGEGEIAIEALVNNDNYLYETERHLKLSVKNNNLTNYQIDGFQKIVFGNKKVFKINGTIIR